MRLRTANPRCKMGIKFSERLLTRCLYKHGHHGMHEARGLEKFPYQRIKWLPGDGREFLTEKESEFAWSERKQKGHA